MPPTEPSTEEPIKGDSTSMEHVEATAGATVTEDPTMLEESISYGPGGLQGILGSGYVFGAASLASLGGISFGYDQGVISIINVMDEFHRIFPDVETEFGKGFMTGMLLLGALVGCLLMPYLADRISRKWALTAAVVVFDTGAIIQTAAQNYGAIVAGRAIGGVGMGALAIVY